MEIKKADSKGRVSGFTPNTHYVIDKLTGRFSEFTLESVQSVFPVQGTAEEAEMLLNQAMAKRNGIE